MKQGTTTSHRDEEKRRGEGDDELMTGGGNPEAQVTGHPATSLTQNRNLTELPGSYDIAIKSGM